MYAISNCCMTRQNPIVCIKVPQLFGTPGGTYCSCASYEVKKIDMIIKKLKMRSRRWHGFFKTSDVISGLRWTCVRFLIRISVSVLTVSCYVVFVYVALKYVA
jgi:hypothetical protein